MKLDSTFALVDINGGREELSKRVGFGIGEESRERIPVKITGFITNQWGGDDGVSAEFQVEVETVEVQS